MLSLAGVRVIVTNRSASSAASREKAPCNRASLQNLRQQTDSLQREDARSVPGHRTRTQLSGSSMRWMRSLVAARYSVNPESPHWEEEFQHRTNVIRVKARSTKRSRPPALAWEEAPLTDGPFGGLHSASDTAESPGRR